MTTYEPQMNDELANNLLMRERTKKNMADRLNYLMSITPHLDTNKKLGKKAGLGENTIARIRNAGDIDPGLGKVESIALCFGMSLADFVAVFDEKLELTVEERNLVNNLRAVPVTIAGPIKANAATLAELYLSRQAADEFRKQSAGEEYPTQRDAAQRNQKN